MQGSASKLGLGYGITPAVTQTMNLASWAEVAGAHPGLRGVFGWESAADASHQYSFATGMAPLVTP
jgi:hypothetical protein